MQYMSRIGHVPMFLISLGASSAESAANCWARVPHHHRVRQHSQIELIAHVFKQPAA